MVLWTAFRTALTRFDKDKMAPEIAVRNTIGFIAAVVLGSVFGSANAGVLAGIGALNVSYSDGRDPYIIRARRMFNSAVLCGVAVTCGALSAHSNAAAVSLATVWAFAAGMLVALGTSAGDLGVVTLVTVIVFAARPLAPIVALQSGLLALCGGLLQLLLAIALWPIRRYDPERRIIANLYTSLAEVAKSPPPSASPPPVSGAISDAQDALSSLLGDHGEEAERLVFLLNQAERIRLSLLSLCRLLRRIERDHQGKKAANSLLAVLTEASRTLEQFPAGTPERFQNAVRGFDGARWGAHSGFFAALIADTRQELETLAGQLRAVYRAGQPGTWQPGAREPWRLRFSGALAKLQANFSLNATVFRHAARLAVCIAIGDALGRALSLQRTYWIPMTIAIVLKPDFTGTLSRGALRIAGTFAGLILATLLFHFVHTGIGTDIH